MTAAAAKAKYIEEQVRARRAQFALANSKYLLWAASAAAAVILVSWIPLSQYPQLLLTAIAAGLLAAVSWVCVLLHRRDRVDTAIYLLLGGLLLLLTVVPVLLPELLLAIPAGYAVFTALGYLLLGSQRGRWLIAVSAIAYGINVLLNTFSLVAWFAPLEGTARIILGAALGEVVLVLAALIIRTVVLGQEALFRDSQQANLELLHRAAVGQEQREYLQTTIDQYVAFMSTIGQGDLSSRLTLDGQDRSPDDPLLVLGRSLNDTVANLQRMTIQIRDTAANLTSAASEILAATTQQAAGANEQAAAIAQTSTTIDEVRAIADQTAQRAQSGADIAQRTAQVSQSGQQAVAAASGGMEEVKDRVETIASNILALSEQAQAIGSIVSSVNEIAKKSNMLALNAAVEAARAGESGKGFAVVAAEVRALSEQSRAATGQVQELLTEIQRGVNTAVMATEEGNKRADAGMRLVAEAGQSIQGLSEEVISSTQVSMQIAAAANQQLTGMEQIGTAMENIYQVTAQSLASTQQSERAAEELNELARQLRDIVEQYRL